MPLFRRSAKKAPPRVEASKETETYQFKSHGLTLQMAYVSQRGYYPDNLNKLNQDSWCLLPNFCQKTQRMFFGVFDGHGEMGTACSKFAMQQIPRLVGGERRVEQRDALPRRRALLCWQLGRRDRRDVAPGVGLGCRHLANARDGKPIALVNDGRTRAELALLPGVLKLDARCGEVLAGIADAVVAS